MKRQNLLLAGCIMGSVSVGLNVWFLMHKREPHSATPAAATHPAPADAVMRALQPVEMDFSGTAFANDSSKLTDGKVSAAITGATFGDRSLEVRPKPDPAFSLDQPFAWKDVKPAGGPQSVADQALPVPAPK